VGFVDCPCYLCMLNAWHMHESSLMPANAQQVEGVDARTHARTHARMHACTHTHTHTHAHKHAIDPTSALRAVKELDEEMDELRLPLAAEARALAASASRLEAAADARRLGVRATPEESVAAFADSSRRIQAALRAGGAAVTAAAAHAREGAAAGVGQQHRRRPRAVQWFGSLRVTAHAASSMQRTSCHRTRDSSPLPGQSRVKAAAASEADEAGPVRAAVARPQPCSARSQRGAAASKAHLVEERQLTDTAIAFARARQDEPQVCLAKVPPRATFAASSGQSRESSIAAAGRPAAGTGDDWEACGPACSRSDSGSDDVGSWILSGGCSSAGCLTSSNLQRQAGERVRATIKHGVRGTRARALADAYMQLRAARASPARAASGGGCWRAGAGCCGRAEAASGRRAGAAAGHGHGD
jgi:hypothetical protein